MLLCMCVWSLGEGSNEFVGVYKINLHEIKSCKINSRVIVCVCVCIVCGCVCVCACVGCAYSCV